MSTLAVFGTSLASTLNAGGIDTVIRVGRSTGARIRAPHGAGLFDVDATFDVDAGHGDAVLGRGDRAVRVIAQFGGSGA